MSLEYLLQRLANYKFGFGDADPYSRDRTWIKEIGKIEKSLADKSLTVSNTTNELGVAENVENGPIYKW